MVKYFLVLVIFTLSAGCGGQGTVIESRHRATNVVVQNESARPVPTLMRPPDRLFAESIGGLRITNHSDPIAKVDPEYRMWTLPSPPLRYWTLILSIDYHNETDENLIVLLPGDFHSTTVEADGMSVKSTKVAVFYPNKEQVTIPGNTTITRRYEAFVTSEDIDMNTIKSVEIEFYCEQISMPPNKMCHVDGKWLGWKLSYSVGP